MEKDQKAGAFPDMNHFSNGKKRKLNYIIHNPNTNEETAKTLLAVFMQVNAKKVEGRLMEWAKCAEKQTYINPCDSKLSLSE